METTTITVPKLTTTNWKTTVVSSAMAVGGALFQYFTTGQVTVVGGVTCVAVALLGALCGDGGAVTSLKGSVTKLITDVATVVSDLAAIKEELTQMKAAQTTTPTDEAK